MAVATLTATLTRNDASILSALFDPEATLAGPGQTMTTTLSTTSDEHFSRALYLERDSLDDINVESPSAANIDITIAKLDSVIDQYPTHASGYNNRAQALRMRFNLTSSPTDLRLIWSDLSTSISLTSPSSATASMPELHRKVLSSAHTHRGHLLYSASRDDKLFALLNSHINSIAGLEKENLEEMASRDFALGGKYGNATAREMAVRTNPYAKLCGSIVKEAMRKEIEEYYQIDVQKAPN